jgi:hypothetical protein
MAERLATAFHVRRGTNLASDDPDLPRFLFSQPGSVRGRPKNYYTPPYVRPSIFYLFPSATILTASLSLRRLRLSLKSSPSTSRPVSPLPVSPSHPSFPSHLPPNLLHQPRPASSSSQPMASTTDSTATRSSLSSAVISPACVERKLGSRYSRMCPRRRRLHQRIRMHRDRNRREARERCSCLRTRTSRLTS